MPAAKGHGLESMYGQLTNSGHPHGEHEIDYTAFLGTRKDCHLERENGWTGIDVLHMFNKLD